MTAVSVFSICPVPESIAGMREEEFVTPSGQDTRGILGALGIEITHLAMLETLSFKNITKWQLYAHQYIPNPPPYQALGPLGHEHTLHCLFLSPVSRQTPLSPLP